MARLTDDVEKPLETRCFLYFSISESFAVTISNPHFSAYSEYVEMSSWYALTVFAAAFFVFIKYVKNSLIDFLAVITIPLKKLLSKKMTINIII